MADPVTIPDDQPTVEETAQDDVEMEGAADGAAADGEELPGAVDEPPRRVPFLEYLKSPMVQVAVGSGNDRTILSAHQDLLTKSPYFEQQCANFSGTSDRIIDLPDEEAETVGSALEFIYNGEYFPKRMGDGKDGGLETDPSIPSVDSDGEQLLKHARIYTLAEKLHMPILKSIAHTKIHRTTSTARGEIAYARYVYANTSTTDTTIRQPVAAFWATRSHVLRHDAEEEFRAMCLEFPQFGFDVLSRVLDQRERKGIGGGGMSGMMGDVGVAVESSTPGTGKGRKRARVGGV